MNGGLIEKFEMWGGPPGPRLTPASAFVSCGTGEPDQGSSADEGVRPTAKGF
jgi:hypothetical protein